MGKGTLDDLYIYRWIKPRHKWHQSSVSENHDFLTLQPDENIVLQQLRLYWHLISGVVNSHWQAFSAQWICKWLNKQTFSPSPLCWKCQTDKTFLQDIKKRHKTAKQTRNGGQLTEANILFKSHMFWIRPGLNLLRMMKH